MTRCLNPYKGKELEMITHNASLLLSHGTEIHKWNTYCCLADHERRFKSLGSKQGCLNHKVLNVQKEFNVQIIL